MPTSNFCLHKKRSTRNRALLFLTDTLRDFNTELCYNKQTSENRGVSRTKRSRIPWPEEWKKKKLFYKAVSYSTKDFIVSAFLYFASVALCLLLRRFDLNNDSSYVAMIFLLDVFFTSFLTDGYLFSILMAIVGVLSVDYIFTPPYWAISFTVAGFPLTFLVMLTISLVTATVTTRAKRADAAAREAEREKIHSNLLRAVSHDIRTPLTGIVGATNVLLEQEGLTAEQQRELLKGANEDAQWLIRIVENLLSITRISGSETPRVNKTPEAAEEILESAVSKFRKRYPAVKVDVQLPEDILIVPMDPLLMEQVFLNLLENAAVHGKDLKLITVFLRQRDAMAEFVVEDDGEGISADALKSLFNSAAQSSRHGDNKRNMGIGLSVCRTIVQAHGGTIKGENKETGGARFTVLLPMEEDSYED